MLPFSVCASLFLDVEDVAEGCFGSVEAVRESFLVLGRYIGIRRVQCVSELVVQFRALLTAHWMMFFMVEGIKQPF